ncbi:WD40 repeat domain-containing protein, partial [Dactylosporangium sp. NPDC051485]|uniref:WD40 repeat domain-containing protein n=1 Tax=Dactylosporangium sp. NPDC051485 TaxID=3154846 RepID=UPI0034402988
RVSRVDAATGRTAGPPLRPGVQSPAALAQSPDGALLAALNGRRLTVWTTADGTARDATFPVGSPLDPPASGLAFAPDGSRLALVHPDGAAGLVHLPDPSGDEARLPVGAAARDVAFAPDGRTLAVATELDTQLWDVAAGTRARSLPGAARAVAWAGPDTLVTTDGRRVVRWDLPSGRSLTLGDPDPGTGTLTRLAVAKGPGLVAATTTGGAVELWDLDSGHRLDGTLFAPAPAALLAFTADGGTLLASGPTLIRWSVDPQRVTAWVCDVVQRNLTDAEWRAYGSGPRPRVCPGLPMEGS